MCPRQFSIPNRGNEAVAQVVQRTRWICDSQFYRVHDFKLAGPALYTSCYATSTLLIRQYEADLAVDKRVRERVFGGGWTRSLRFGR